MRPLFFILLLMSDQVKAITAEDLGSWYVNFNYQLSSIKAEHRETSSDGGFQSPDFKENYRRHNLYIQFEKEILSHWPVSVSVFPIVGIGVVTDSEKNREGFKIEESLLGTSFGGGVSLNINSFGEELKSQPFVSFAILKARDAFFLRYDNLQEDQRSREIETVEEYDLVMSSAGVRFFNTKQLICTLAISVYQYDNFEVETTASQGEQEYNLSNTAQYTRDNASIMLGFGYIF